MSISAYNLVVSNDITLDGSITQNTLSNNILGNIEGQSINCENLTVNNQMQINDNLIVAGNIESTGYKYLGSDIFDIMDSKISSLGSLSSIQPQINTLNTKTTNQNYNSTTDTTSFNKLNTNEINSASYKLNNVDLITTINNSVDTKINNLVGSAPSNLDTLKELADLLTTESNLTNSLLSSISGINSSITTLNSNVSNLSTTQNNYTSEITNLNTSLMALNTRQDLIDTSNNAQTVDITNLKSDNITNKSNILTLQTDNTSNKNRLNTLETDNTTNKSNIATLQTDNTTNKSNIATLQTDNTTNKANITSLQTDNTSNKNRLSTLETDNTTNKNRISTLESDNTTNKSSINTINGTLSGMSYSLASDTTVFDNYLTINKGAQLAIVNITDVYNNTYPNGEIIQYNGEYVFTNHSPTGSITFRTKNGSTFSDYMKLSSTQCLFNLNLKSTGNLLLSSANIINNANTIEIRGNNASSKLSIFNKDSSNNESETAGFTNDLIYLNKQSQINGTLNMLGNNIINTGSINTSSLTASNLTIDKIGSTTNIKVGNNLSFKYGLCAYLISSTGQTIPISFSMTKLPAQVVNNVYRIILMPNYKVVGYDLEFYGGSSVSFGYSELKTQDPLNPIVPIFFNGWNSSSTPMNLKVNEFVNWEIYSMKCYYNDGTSLIEMTVPFISDGTTSIY